MLDSDFNAMLGKDVVMPDYPSAAYAGSVKKIGFDSPPRTLADGEYATQENNAHWVKLRGYALIKINPEFIVNDSLSNEGKAHIEMESVIE